MKKLICTTVCVALLAGAAAPAAEYKAVLAKAKAAMGHAEKAGKLIPAGQPAEAYQPTAADKKRGLVVFAPSLNRTFTDRKPMPEEVRPAVTVRAARGETESVLLAVHALSAKRRLSISAEGPTPAGVTVEFLPVVMAPMAQGKSSYRVVGLWLARGGQVDVGAGHSRAWLVRVSVAADAKPGDYAIVRSFTDDVGRSRVYPAPRINIKVLPFKLADPWARKYVFGAFTAGANFNVAQYRQMKAHGIESVQWFWGHYGMDVLNENGKLKMDFKDLDRTVAAFQKAGMRGPIVLGLGNDSSGHYERAICRQFNLPLQPQVKRDKKVVKMAVLDNPKIEELIVEGLRQLFAHAKEAKYPEIVILPYDEATERLMKEHRRMVGLLKKHFPAVRLYGVTMNRLRWAKMVADTDILVCNGDFARIRKFATEKNKGVWFYGGATTRSGYGGCRWRYGLRMYAYKPDGVFFWCYNYHPGDPWNDFDSHTADSAWVICWPRLTDGGGGVETLAYEGLREGVDDVRYAMTLERLLESRARSSAQAKVRGEYVKWLEGLRKARPKPSELAALRGRIVKWILRARAAAAE